MSMICNNCQQQYEAPKPIYDEKTGYHKQDPKRNRWLCEKCNAKENERKKEE